MMPDMDGYQLCRRFRESPRLSRVPILILTARAQPVDRAASMRAGADAYISKPFQRAELVRTVQNLVAAQSGASSNRARLISCVSLRGGVGVSVLAVNLARRDHAETSPERAAGRPEAFFRPGRAVPEPQTAGRLDTPGGRSPLRRMESRGGEPGQAPVRPDAAVRASVPLRDRRPAARGHPLGYQHDSGPFRPGLRGPAVNAPGAHARRPPRLGPRPPGSGARGCRAAVGLRPDLRPQDRRRAARAHRLRHQSPRPDR